MTIDNVVSVRDASKDLANKFREQFNELGYHLSYGHTHINAGQPVILVNAQYTSWRRIFYTFGSEKIQNKIRELVPQEYEYNGKIFPTKLSFLDSGKFL
ncbi:MAG: hypothetical protein ACP5N1_00920 [Candidatus Woesearchaeota archaeon]